MYPHLPLEPGANFPSDVQDDGAFPPEPYDFAFWGFPCIKQALQSEPHRHRG